jgi:hypothetical protein
MGATSGAGTAYSSGAPEFTTLYQRYPDMCCWNGVAYKWEVHNLEIEIISFWS